VACGRLGGEKVVVVAVKERERLVELVGLLPDRAVLVVERFVRWLIAEEADPMARLLAEAPVDDEPLMPEEEAALEEARASVARGEVVPYEEVIRVLHRREAYRG